MRKAFLFILVTIGYILHAQGVSDNEYLKYRVHYGFLNAGYATLNVTEENYAGTPHWHVVGKGYSTGAVRLFFKVDDRYETYINQSNFKPSKFIRDINEGGYTKNKVLYFDHDRRLVKENNLEANKVTTYSYNRDVQDMLSAFYYLRSFKNTDFVVGTSKTVDVFMDEQIYSFKLKVLGREKVETKFGDIDCIKMRPYVQSGRVFKAQESVTLWVSDDDNLIPMQLEAELVVGSLKMSISEYKNTKYPLKFK